MSELRQQALTLVIVMPMNQVCRCGHTLVNDKQEVVKSTYLAVRDGALVAKCPRCRLVSKIGHPVSAN